jgi:ligand-binding SRPBCC domain-containing protein
MPQFTHAFEVKAKQQEVAAFHDDTRALKWLTPPPMFVQLQDIEPLGEGSRSRFTMWFGPIPARWRAVHTDVSAWGFTDSQEVGPLRRWRHRHTFEALDDERTLVVDQVIYDHHGGWRGLLTRLVFNRPGLALLFTYRKWATRWYLRKSQERARLARRALVLSLLPLAFVLLLLWKGGEP